jgi:hypothetical protein
VKFITAFSRHRIERQKYCLQSWLEHASEVVAVQTAEDIQILQQHFPEVQFVETKLTGEFLYQLPNRVRIKALVDQGPGLLINSDIKVSSTKSEFAKDWKPSSRQLSVGIRYDFDGPGKPKKLNSHGIDAYLITEEVMKRLPDVGFVIGVSVWDYWFIWHMMCERFQIKAKTTPGLLHLRHPVNWSEVDTKIGFGIMESVYGLREPKKILDAVIPVMTNRTKPN